MKLGRFETDSSIRTGVVLGEEVALLPDGITAVELAADGQWADTVAELIAGGTRHRAGGMRIDVPIIPRQLLAIGANYRDHAAEAGEQVRAVPIVFGKLPSSLSADGADIVIPDDADARVDFEAELAVVVGRPDAARRSGDPLDAVFGYTCAHDVSARGYQAVDGQWMRAKSLPTFTPLGPYIVTADEIRDPDALHITGTLNGEVMQDGMTSLMIYPVRDLMGFLLDTFTLWPGDVILTGTPGGVGAFRSPPRVLTGGDEFVIDISEIGTLTNRVRVRR